MKAFTRYSTVDGYIQSIGICQDSVYDEETVPGFATILGQGNQVTQYVDLVTEELTDKPAGTIDADKSTVAADGVEIVTLSGFDIGDIVHMALDGVPVNLFVYAAEYEELTFDVTGLYTFYVDARTKLPAEINIDAT
jgi:hypothetical protein